MRNLGFIFLLLITSIFVLLDSCTLKLRSFRRIMGVKLSSRRAIYISLASNLSGSLNIDM